MNATEELTEAIATLDLDEYYQPRPLFLPLTGVTVMAASRARVQAMYMNEALAAMRAKAKPEPAHKAAQARIFNGTATLSDYEEVRSHGMAEYLNERQEMLARGLHKTGKTRRHVANRYFDRRRERRIKHEGWMKSVSNNPNAAHPHPFIT